MGNPKAVAKWRGRSGTAGVRPGPKGALSTVLSIEDEAIIVASESIYSCRWTTGSAPCRQRSHT